MPLQFIDWYDEASVCDGSFVIRSTDLTTFMRGLGSTEWALFDSLEESKRDQICSEFSSFVVGVANAVTLIDPERDADNLAANQSLPPMLPKEFASMMPSSFVAVVIRFRSHLEKNSIRTTSLSWKRSSAFCTIFTLEIRRSR